MLSILGIIVLVVLIIKVSSLSSRLSDLENRLTGKVQEFQVKKDSSSTIEGKEFLAPASVEMKEMTNQNIYREPLKNIKGEPNKFIEWLKADWIIKLGVILILIGFGWFISYAFVHNWIGPIGRVAFGFSIGAVLCILGAWRLPKNNVQGNVFLILGSAAVMITGYASRTVYDFFNPATILALNFLVAAYITTLSAKFNRENLALYGVLVSLVAPVLTHSPEPSILGLFIYLAVISSASIWVTVVKGWGSVNVISLLGVLVYSALFIFGSSYELLEVEKLYIIVITFLLALAYFIVNILSIIKAGEEIEVNSTYIAIGNSILVLFITNTLAIEEIRSLLLAAWMIIFAAGSLMVSNHTKKQTFFYIYSLISILFLGIATAIELEGPVLAIAFSLEAAIITILAYITTQKLTNSVATSLLMIIPASLAIESLDAYYWKESIFHSDSLVVTLVAVLLFILGFFFMNRYKEGIHDSSIKTSFIILNSTGSAFSIAIIWRVTHTLFSSDLATIISLAIFTIVGIITYVKGAFEESKPFKYFGSVLLILVIARLIIVDVWQMPLASRIVVFIVIGALLVSTAFIGKRKVDKIENNEK